MLKRGVVVVSNWVGVSDVVDVIAGWVSSCSKTPISYGYSGRTPSGLLHNFVLVFKWSININTEFDVSWPFRVWFKFVRAYPFIFMIP